ncbi:MAG: tyrosine-type recombinase/integrase [Fibrella sp.]|nr:tyrosine-type recombinase/integrase [Armatimonadota bacterium]
MTCYSETHSPSIAYATHRVPPVRSACRIGEMLALKIEDYKEDERRILIRESKGRQPRTLPGSPAWASALSIWLRMRRRIMSGKPDDGLLFVSELGGPIDTHKFIHTLHSITKYAGLSEGITLHSLRRYSINKLAKNNLLAAQTIAGHKDAKTTLLYTRLDPDFLRDVHSEVGVLDKVIESKREKRRRLV